MERECVLLVDDEPNVLQSLKRDMIDEDYAVVTAESAEDGLNLLLQQPVQLIIADESMPGMSGTEFLSIVRQQYPYIIRIILTGKASLESAMKAVNEGEIYRFFTKPWDNIEFKLAIRLGLEKYCLEEEKRILLGTVKVQTEELSHLEKQFPGITDIKTDESGAVVLPELSEEEVASIMNFCRKEYHKDCKD